MKKIKKILIANRGEIAIRICRTLQKMDIKPVLIHSEIDRNSYFLSFSKEKYQLSGQTVAETYLNINQIIEIAQKSHCDAIHPGYGFLSENTRFAKAARACGIIFIGPDSEVISTMGNKLHAKQIAEKAGVPTIPEIKDHIESEEYPLLIKAAAGGGGKGMRIVNNIDEYNSALLTCSGESKNAFGDGTVFVEKYFPGSRHIEVQILGDNFGNAVHLFERECSVQRRYQKIIEESPAVVLSPILREKICNAAVMIAREINYSSAGTIEFLLDKNQDFYFLEMNTRIQVEHPVTEMVTGLDIVEEQIKIAEEKKLTFLQKDIRQTGHAIECRIYAEDPQKDFCPSPGKIKYYREPDQNENIRLDSSINSEEVISSVFDPMIAKLICYGENRLSVIQNMITSIDQYKIIGIKNNKNFLKAILTNEKYRKNKLHTRYCEDEKDTLLIQSHMDLCTEDKVSALASVFSGLIGKKRTGSSIWTQIGSWRLFNILSFIVNGEMIKVEYQLNTDNCSLNIENRSYRISNIRQSENQILYYLDGKYCEAILLEKENGFLVEVNNREITVERKDYLNEKQKIVSSGISSGGKIIYPDIPGKVLDIRVGEGDEVKEGESLIVLEAMKMESLIQSPFDCKVEKINCSIGESVQTTSPMIILEEK